MDLTTKECRDLNHKKKRLIIKITNWILLAQQDTSETTVLIRGSPVVVNKKWNTAQFKHLDFFDGHHDELFTSHFWFTSTFYDVYRIWWKQESWNKKTFLYLFICSKFVAHLWEGWNLSFKRMILFLHKHLWTPPLGKMNVNGMAEGWQQTGWESGS